MGARLVAGIPGMRLPTCAHTHPPAMEHEVCAGSEGHISHMRLGRVNWSQSVTSGLGNICERTQRRIMRTFPWFQTCLALDRIPPTRTVRSRNTGGHGGPPVRKGVSSTFINWHCQWCRMPLAHIQPAASALVRAFKRMRSGQRSTARWPHRSVREWDQPNGADRWPSPTLNRKPGANVSIHSRPNSGGE
jgi:hypothetical protein